MIIINDDQLTSQETLLEKRPMLQLDIHTGFAFLIHLLYCGPMLPRNLKKVYKTTFNINKVNEMTYQNGQYESLALEIDQHITI